MTEEKNYSYRTYRDGRNEELVEKISDMLVELFTRIEYMIENDQDSLNEAKQLAQEHKDYSEIEKSASICEERLSISENLSIRLSELDIRLQKVGLLLDLWEAKNREEDYYCEVINNGFFGEMSTPETDW